MFKGNKRTAEQIEAAAEAASRKACAAGPRPSKGAKVLSSLWLEGSEIVVRRNRYPVKGARAEVSDFRSGLVGRRHTITITLTLASGEVVPWTSTTAGTMSRVVYRQALAFAAAVNTAA